MGSIKEDSSGYCSSFGAGSGFDSVTGSLAMGAFCSSSVVDALGQRVSNMEFDGISGDYAGSTPKFGGVYGV